MAPIGVAVVGYGYWGPNLARNVATSDQTELRAVCDLSEDARARAEKLHPGTWVTGDWDAVLADPEVEAVVVALPIALHHRVALEALDAGKHVLVEKPLATSVAECDELIAAAERSGLVLMAGHTFEYNAAVEAVREYLVAGELGEPYYVSMRRTNLGIVRHDANAMWNLAPHDISILCHWLDSAPVSVSATGVAQLQPDIHDVVFLSVMFESGVLGHVHCSWLDPNKVREATLVGSRKMVRYDDVSPDQKIWLYDKGIVREEVSHPDLGRYEDFGRFQMLARAGDVVIPKVHFREPLAREVAEFADSIRSRRAPRTDGRNGRRVVSILEAAQRSLAEGGAVQELATPAAAGS
jgi:predicted dehydrogenase